jgi:hypothetical protein
VQRFAVTLACALAVLCTPLSASAQTTSTGTGTRSSTAKASVRPQTNIAKLPVCGQPASSAKSSGSSRTTKPKRGTAGTPKKKTAAKRTGKRNKRRQGAGGKKAAASVGRQPVRATLTLDQEDQETVTAAAFGRTTDPQPLTLVYRVSGCRVTADLSLPRSPLPTGPVSTAGARPLAFGSVQIDDVDADGDRYVVYLRVFVSSDKAKKQGGIVRPSATATETPTGDGAAGSTETSAPVSQAAEFSVPPGSYTSFVRLEADWMHTIATPVTVTRSEDSEWIAVLIGMAGGASGFIIFMVLRVIHGKNLLIKEKWVLWFTAAVSIGVGAGTAYFTNYLNQEVWTFNANGVALFTAAFSASTAGVAAGLLTGIYNTDQAGGLDGHGDGGGGAGAAAGGGGVHGGP